MDDIYSQLTNPDTFGFVPDAGERAQVAIVDCIGLVCECDEDEQGNPGCRGDCQRSDFVGIVAHAVSHAPLAHSPLHGLRHWLGVYRNAIMLAHAAGLHPPESSDGMDFTAVALLFALFHDCRRTTEGPDVAHGAFGALALGAALQSPDTLPVAHLEGVTAQAACNLHTVVDYPATDRAFQFSGDLSTLAELGSDEPTMRAAIGMCLDADRIELLRLGRVPSKPYLSHPEAVSAVIDHLWKHGAYEQ